jgi:ribose/xylose/arabinose/galactoside ABC-type transport system permease subunit
VTRAHHFRFSSRSGRSLKIAISKAIIAVVGRELFWIAAVVVGGTLLTGDVGPVGTTLASVLPLGLIFNVLNFENG